MTIDAELNLKFRFDVNLNRILPNLLRLTTKPQKPGIQFLQYTYVNGPKTQPGSNLCSWIMFPQKRFHKKVKNTNFSPISNLLFLRLTKTVKQLFVCLYKHNRNLKTDKKKSFLIYILFSLVSRNVFVFSRKLHLMWIIHLQEQLPEVLQEKVFLEISQNSKEITCDRVSFLTAFKKGLWHRCFPVSFAKFLRTPFLQNISGRLLLHVLVLTFHLSDFSLTSDCQEIKSNTASAIN